jgi:DNA adenine methylase
MEVTSDLRFRSPLRYPGGKGRLAPFMARLIEANGLSDGHYAEAYAGGAAAALKLLYDEHVTHIHLNDLDRGVYAFWFAAINHTDELCSLIMGRPATVREWNRQRDIQANKPSADLLDLGFSTFFLNRTNRSGIIAGGLIGGKAQDGVWRMDARLNRVDLVRRVERVAQYKGRISLYNLDALDFLALAAGELPDRSILYCDPPYYLEGKRNLYPTYYDRFDHSLVAQAIQSMPLPWVVSYDFVPEIVRLYQGVQRITYDLNYSAMSRYRGQEVMFFSNGLVVPRLGNPAYVNSTRDPGGFAKIPQRRASA